MENALEPEITAFRHDLLKMEASVRRLIMVANNQLKKVSQISKACLLDMFYLYYKIYDTEQKLEGKRNEGCWTGFL